MTVSALVCWRSPCSSSSLGGILRQHPARSPLETARRGADCGGRGRRRFWANPSGASRARMKSAPWRAPPDRLRQTFAAARRRKERGREHARRHRAQLAESVADPGRRSFAHRALRQPGAHARGQKASVKVLENRKPRRGRGGWLSRARAHAPSPVRPKAPSRPRAAKRKPSFPRWATQWEARLTEAASRRLDNAGDAPPPVQKPSPMRCSPPCAKRWPSTGRCAKHSAGRRGHYLKSVGEDVAGALLDAVARLNDVAGRLNAPAKSGCAKITFSARRAGA